MKTINNLPDELKGLTRFRGNISVCDVARYIVNSHPDISIDTMRLMRIIYIMQCWALGLTNTRLFREHIEAWDNGPIIRALSYQIQHGKRFINTKRLQKRLEGFYEVKKNSDESILIDYIVANYRNCNTYTIIDKLKIPGSPWDVTVDLGDLIISESIIARIYNSALSSIYDGDSKPPLDNLLRRSYKSVSGFFGRLLARFC